MAPLHGETESIDYFMQGESLGVALNAQAHRFHYFLCSAGHEAIENKRIVFEALPQTRVSPMEIK